MYFPLLLVVLSCLFRSVNRADASRSPSRNRTASRAVSGIWRAGSERSHIALAVCSGLRTRPVHGRVCLAGWVLTLLCCFRSHGGRVWRNRKRGVAGLFLSSLHTIFPAEFGRSWPIETGDPFEFRKEVGCVRCVCLFVCVCVCVRGQSGQGGRPFSRFLLSAAWPCFSLSERLL